MIKQTERRATTMADPNDTLRDLRIYLSSNGNTQGFAQYVYTYRVEDQAGQVVYTNEGTPGTIHGGSPDLGFHACLLDWLPRWRDMLEGQWSEDLAAGLKAEGSAVDALGPALRSIGADRTLTVVTSDGDRVMKAYTVPAAELVASGFHWANGQLIGNAAWVSRVLADAEEIRVTIRARPLAGVPEELALNEVRRAGKRRWTAALAAKRDQFRDGAA
jgi:hypothetical protein